jgi:hypothetical protein
MDYNLGFVLAFNTFFYYNFISIFFIRVQYMIHDGKKKKKMKKNTTKSLMNK